MRDPKVIEPPDFDASVIWAQCDKHCSNAVRADGSINWSEAAGADPGVIGCPNCEETYWHLGAVVECLECKFQFPTDWYDRYVRGVHDGRVVPGFQRHGHLHADPYYQYGLQHPSRCAR